jgi:glycerol-3-phosphate dehydrogenase
VKRSSGLERLKRETFDLLIVGGGATGLGCALDAAARGYRTGLIEARDIASGTSSRSTKLIHGGVRYLRGGNVALVREALRERELLLRNAPEIVRPLEFFVPARSLREKLYYAAGLRLYDVLARGSTLPLSRMTRGGVCFYDAQFDDARLAIAIAQTAVDRGAAVANYVRADSFIRDTGRIAGVVAIDEETHETFAIRARCVVNAAGIFADAIRRMDDPSAPAKLSFSRGTHVVVSQSAFDPGTRALLVPSTSDGRVLFAIPWHGRTLIGTTDVAVDVPEAEPRPSRDEIAWLLEAIAPYAGSTVERSDVTSAFAGLRPLRRAPARRTADLSRDHAVEISESGLVSVLGGKWTTYRSMAQEAVDVAVRTAALPAARSNTERLLLCSVPQKPEIAYAARREMARTPEDALARRDRVLFLDAREALERAPSAARVLAHELNRDDAWCAEQVGRFEALARRYTLQG